MHPCPFCHASLPQDAPFCPTCGQQIEWIAPPQAPPPEVARLPDFQGLGVGPPSTSMLSRELPIDREAPGGRIRSRTSELGPSFRIAHPIESLEPEGVTASGADRMSGSETEGRPVPRVVRVAPVWRRLSAWLVDSVLLLAIVCGFLWMAAGLVHRGVPSRQAGVDWLSETVLALSGVWLPALALFSVITVGYLALFTALGGQTPGKRLLGLQVVDANGDEPGIPRSALRALLALGSGLLVLMGFLLVVFDRRRQALHDKLAHTYVICQG
jgi:uncharacterized RDD family membrane protein YckC